MKILISLAAIAAAFAALPAAAQDRAPAARPQVVRFADLDLHSQAGVKALDRRLGLAVRNACGSASDADLHGRNLVKACRDATRQSVASQRQRALASAGGGGAVLASQR